MEDNELSDWDDESESDDNIERETKTPKKRANSIVNVRDRTSGLSNVFSGKAPTRSSFVFSSTKPLQDSAAHSNREKATISDRYQEEIGEDLPEENTSPEKPPNENDCIAESMNSVWD